MASVIQLVPTSRKRGKKGRKFGRKERRPGHKRYNDEKRWLKNKYRRIKKNNGEAAALAYRKEHSF